MLLLKNEVQNPVFKSKCGVFIMTEGFIFTKQRRKKTK